MNITQYVKSLKGVISKDDAKSTLDNVIQELSTKVLPISATAAAAFKVIKIKSKEVIGLDERYRNALKLGRNGNMFVDINTRLLAAHRVLNTLGELLDKTLPETVTATTIDHRSATILHLIDSASFLNRYVRRLIEAAAVYETEAVGMYEDYQKANLTKGEAVWLESRFGYFLETLEALSETPQDFKKKFDEIPMVKVDTDGDSVSVFGRLKMDPFKLGFIPIFLNPFWHIGKWIVELQAWRYKEAQEDLKRVQQRILLLEEAVAGKANPSLEKELMLQRDKAEGLIYKINKAEEEM